MVETIEGHTLSIDADNLLFNIDSYACTLPGLGVILLLWYVYSMYHA
jgi:hypothetical protein